MAFEYGFYNSISGDRTYNATHFSKIFDGVITDGVFAGIGDKLFTTAGGGMTIKVGTGKAWFDHTWNTNTTIMPLTISPSNPVLARYDTVVLEINDAQNIQGRINTIKVVSGTPSSNPAKPALTNTQYIHQHPLAHVFVPASATQITAGNIEIVVGTTACPFVTSILQTTDISGLFANWEYQFNVWFEHLKLYLNEDVVTNLQNQIDNCYKKTDFATWEQYIEGGSANNGKLVRVDVSRKAINLATNTRAMIIKNSGNYTMPRDSWGQGWVIAIGGGGGGGGGKATVQGQTSIRAGGGGGSGIVGVIRFDFSTVETITILIGYGGAPGQAGGATQFLDLICAGGEPGTITNGGSGGAGGGGGTTGGNGSGYGGGGGGVTNGGNGGNYGGAGTGPNTNGTSGALGGQPGAWGNHVEPAYGWIGYINRRPFCNLVDGINYATGATQSSTLGGAGGFNGVGGNSSITGVGGGGGGMYGPGGHGYKGAGGGGGFNGRGGDGGGWVYGSAYGGGGGGGGGIDIGDGACGGDGVCGGKGGVGYGAGGGGGGVLSEFSNYTITGGVGAQGVVILIWEVK